MQLRAICKSKIHRATVTEANLEYIGSIEIDEDLLRRVDIVPGEKVAVWNLSNGERIETYAISAPQGSGSIVVNGAAARKFREKDQVIIDAFVLTDEQIEPRMILVDSRNHFVGDLGDNRPESEVSIDVTIPAAELTTWQT